jgi:hypothetical protein
MKINTEAHNTPKKILPSTIAIINALRDIFNAEP